MVIYKQETTTSGQKQLNTKCFRIQYEHCDELWPNLYEMKHVKETIILPCKCKINWCAVRELWYDFCASGSKFGNPYPYPCHSLVRGSNMFIKVRTFYFVGEP
jgi:hypothetical protein